MIVDVINVLIFDQANVYKIKSAKKLLNYTPVNNKLQNTTL